MHVKSIDIIKLRFAETIDPAQMIGMITAYFAYGDMNYYDERI
ncbi:MAG: hypothetical protein U9P81_06325 [Euryarchaeota archaeon]|nr:hypothetical protein [Euryarchaeota archaeon]